MHDKPTFGAEGSQTLLHPIVLIAMLIALPLLLLLPRRYAVIPFLLIAFLVPLQQEVMIGGFRIFVSRIMIVAGWFRIIQWKISSRGPVLAGGFNTLDKLFLFWAGFRAIAQILFYLQMAAVINQVSFFWDALGGYFLLRFLIRDEKDIELVIKTFAFVVVVLGACMLRERITNENVFDILGGLRQIKEFRNGHIRSQGPFQHEILAGTFGATLIPLFLWLWKGRKSKLAAVGGVLGSTVMTITAGASTAVSAYAAGIMALFFWPLRKKMRQLRWGIVIALCCLQVVMKAPVWFLINHIDLVGGSSSYHRAELIDQFLRHFWSWWLLGTNTATEWGWDMWDAANQYVAEGEVGGLATLICFIAMICVAFRWLGNARKQSAGNGQKQWYIWFLGATLFSHVVAFFGVSYFDQTRISWLALLAIISAAVAPAVMARARAKLRVQQNLPEDPKPEVLPALTPFNVEFL